jgi:two-component system, OmpR family, sensor histidine kinase KdpD
MELQRRNAVGLRLAARYAEAVGAAVVALIIGEVVSGRFSAANVALLLMLAVVFVGLRHGLGPALVTSLACATGMIFFHARPRFSFRVDEVDDLMALGCFLVASLLTGSLAARFRHQLAMSSALAEHNERLYEVSSHLSGAEREQELIASLRRSIESAVRAQCTILIADAHGALVPADASAPALDAVARADAGWCFTRVVDDPRVGTHPGAWAFLRLNGEQGPLGVLGVRSAGGPLAREQRLLLLALRDLAAAAIDRRRLADRIRESEMRAETEKLRAALLSSVSHDLRTPLAGIIGAASTLLGLGSSLRDDDQKELLATVLGEAERLDRFVGNLLDMVRLESGAPLPKPSWCDIRDIVAEAVRGLSRMLADRELELHIEPDFPLLYVDGVLLERVIANLLDNAAKYSPAGTPIQVAAHRERDSAVLRVIDRGPGIPAAEREAVFTLFHRVREADKRVAGTGLGLAICRGLTESLHGSIEVGTGAGDSGACVEVRLPLPEPAEAAVA